MLYIINGCIKFDTLKKTLVSSDSPDIEITLTNSPSLALEILVQNPHNVISRDDVFSKVWGEDGSQISNASLNNYISELRKALRAVKQDDIIVTLPKIGFKLNATINTCSVRKVKKITFKPFIFIVFVLVTIIALLIFLRYYFIEQNKNTLEVQYLYNYNHCSIYYLGDKIQLSEDVELIKKSLIANKINCSSQERDIYYSSGRVLNNVFKSELISICDKNHNGKYTECNNILQVI